jgi:hypothetical protein
MFNVGALSFKEFAMQEPLPLATLHNAVLEFLRDRDDAVLFGAQAVNAYVSEPRMTQDVDVLAIQATELVEELRNHLSERFHIAVRMREIGEGRGSRIDQVQKDGNRHLVDVRPVAVLPAHQRIAQVLVIAPADLIAMKVIAYQGRRGQPKSGTDWRDLAMLLLALPELKVKEGVVAERLRGLNANTEALKVWDELVVQTIQPPNEDDEF